jgi:hypothetical protein
MSSCSCGGGHAQNSTNPAFAVLGVDLDGDPVTPWSPAEPLETQRAREGPAHQPRTDHLLTAVLISVVKLSQDLALNKPDCLFRVHTWVEHGGFEPPTPCLPG